MKEPLTVEGLIELLKEMPRDYVVRCEIDCISANGCDVDCISANVTIVGVDNGYPGRILITGIAQSQPRGEIK